MGGRGATGLFLACVACTLGPSPVAAQVDRRALVAGTTITLQSRALEEARDLLVALPTGYGESADAYPVLYVLDGEFLFSLASGVVDYLDKTNRIPPVIVVGVVNVDRVRDYTPAPGEAEERRYPKAGGADRFLRFLDDEVVPFVDEEFRTQPYRVLFGHSQGGLLTVRAFLTGTTFQGFIAASPSLFWNQKSQVRLLEEVLTSRRWTETSLFLTMGSERDEMMDGVESFARGLDERAPDVLTWRYRHLEGKDHEEMPLPSLVEGLEYSFWDYRDPELVSTMGFTAFRAWQREKYGYQPELPLAFLFAGFTGASRRGCDDMLDLLDYWSERHRPSFERFAGDWLDEGRARLAKGEAPCAERVFRLLLDDGVRPFEANLGLGDALVALHRDDDALSAYRDALALRPDDAEARRRVRDLSGGSRVRLPDPVGSPSVDS